MEPKQLPSVGRIVHFNSPFGTEAALVVKVWNEECVNLVVFSESGVPRSETSVVMGGDVGRWTWPAKV